ncbi:MAG: hypothetical protein KDB14_18510 [Planctomycetales bacterium]|nr:hypothetical protein [Planctomycetales bacterium]
MSFPYQPFYCEENAFLLMDESPVSGLEPWLVFVSNSSRSVLMFHQSAGDNESGCVIWDYHVFVLARADQTVWDLDCSAGFPLSVEQYLAASFADEVPQTWHPRFRAVPAAAARRGFSSDRSHMLDAEGNYLKPPPPWSAIFHGANTLPRLLDMDHDDPSVEWLPPALDLNAFACWAGEPDSLK